MGADHGRIMRTSGAIGPTWAQYGPIMGPSWAQHGPTMGGSWALTWAHDGTIMCHRPSMAPLWADLGPIMDPAWVGQSWTHAVPIMGPPRAHHGSSWAYHGLLVDHGTYIFFNVYIYVYTHVFIYTCIWIHMYQKGPLWGVRVPCSLFMATSPYLYDGLKPFQ